MPMVPVNAPPQTLCILGEPPDVEDAPAPVVLLAEAHLPALRMSGTAPAHIYLEVSDHFGCIAHVSLDPSQGRRLRDWLSLAIEALDP